MNADFFLDAPSPFVLLDAARAMDSPPGLTDWRRCEGVPFWQVMAAAAQAAALQQRVARDFSCHAFLLSVERAPWPAGPLSGTARLDVRVTAQCGRVAASRVRVRGLCGPGGPLPPLELGRDTGFVQAIEPHPLRRLTIELEINRSYGDEARAADAAGKAALRDRVTRELYATRCAQARDRAEKELVWQLGDEVTGPVPKRLEAGNYFAEQRQFNLGLQANGVNFDQFLAVRGQTVEQFRQWLHQQAERKLRSRMGLLLVAQRDQLWPTEAEAEEELAPRDDTRDGEHTFPANDRRRAAQRIASSRAAAFVLAHSTLTPPPAEPTVLKAES